MEKFFVYEEKKFGKIDSWFLATSAVVAVVVVAAMETFYLSSFGSENSMINKYNKMQPF